MTKKAIIEQKQLFTAQDANYTSDSIKIAEYTNFAIQVNYSNTGTLKLQGSIDNVNFVDLVVNAAGDTSISLSGSSELINFNDIGFPYLRVDLTGSVTGVSAWLCVKN